MPVDVGIGQGRDKIELGIGDRRRVIIRRASVSIPPHKIGLPALLGGILGDEESPLGLK
ncbi:MAG: hypothetical protein AB7O62_21100 [Pirellulales bacterium]